MLLKKNFLLIFYFFKTFYALWHGYSLNGWTDFDAQYLKRRRLVRGGAFFMIEKNRNLTLTSKRSKSAILFGLQNFERHYLTAKGCNYRACKLIDGCNLALCSATVSVISAGICYRNEVNSIAWLYRRAQPKDSIHYITLHYITLSRERYEIERWCP